MPIAAGTAYNATAATCSGGSSIATKTITKLAMPYSRAEQSKVKNTLFVKNPMSGTDRSLSYLQEVLLKRLQETGGGGS